MDFRNPHIVGTFVYHCHLLEHEDGGMTGTIQVTPNPDSKMTTNHPKHFSRLDWRQNLAQ
jgi:hypothetical protein